MSVSEALFSGKSNGTPMGTNSAPAIQFSNTFLYINDLFSVNNEEFGNNINTIYPSELELKDNSTSQRMCVTSTQGSSVTTTHLSMSASTIRYDKRDDFTFRTANFPYVDSNISTKPAYSVHHHISQLVRYMPGFARPSWTFEHWRLNCVSNNEASNPLHYSNPGRGGGGGAALKGGLGRGVPPRLSNWPDPV